jgi:hypothetical protein
MVEQFKTIKAYPTMEVSNLGNFRHRAVKGYKGTEIVDIPSLEIDTKEKFQVVLVELPRVNREFRTSFKEENAVGLMIDTFIRRGVPLRKVSFRDGDWRNISIDNIKIQD